MNIFLPIVVIFTVSQVLASCQVFEERIYSNYVLNNELYVDVRQISQKFI